MVCGVVILILEHTFNVWVAVTFNHLALLIAQYNFRAINRLIYII